FCAFCRSLLCLLCTFPDLLGKAGVGNARWNRSCCQGSPFEMGSAQGESLRQKIRSSPDVLAQLYGFRMLQPPWMPYALYRWISESRATRFLENPPKRDFPEAHLRMKGLSEQSEISMGLLYRLHALEPMLSVVSRCAIVPAFAACSAVAVRGGRSATR